MDPSRFWDVYWARREPYDRGLVDGAEYRWGVGEALGRAFSDDDIEWDSVYDA